MNPRLSFAFACLLGSMLLAGVALADDEAHALDRGMEQATEHGAPGQGAEIAGHGEDGAHHEPHFTDINWFYGLSGSAMVWSPHRVPPDRHACALRRLHSERRPPLRPANRSRRSRSPRA